LLFNKLDLFSDEGLEILAQLVDVYKKIGYPCFEVSALGGTNINQAREMLKDKVTLFSGHSGVGKSSLINVLLPDLGLRTSEVSHWSGKGTHTTTFAEMFPLP